ncbi:branched-chain amino acid ABC transporter permease [Daeguia caeni]|uniref:Branched-chain amino acid ABC transporter permease n=1 Tax=Daeguia caeni TaxID=439612 RepID=A0ABV9HAH9_9HYPH
MSSPSSSAKGDFIGMGVLVVGLIAADLLLGSHFYRGLALQIMIFSIASVGLTLLVGFTGQISIGQNAFVAIGAYMLANAVQALHLHPVIGVILGTLLSALLGFLIARPILRLQGHYLGLATLAIGAAAQIIASQWREVTGGLDPGIVDLPALTIGSTNVLFWFVGLCLVIVVGLALCVVHSPVGRALQTIRTSETLAAGNGIPVAATKAAVFAFSAGTAGLAGGLYALFMRSFNAGSFGVMMSIELLMMVMVGSLSTIWGGLFGAALVILLPQALEHFENAKLFIYGTIMTLVVMFMPSGLASSAFHLIQRLFGRKEEVSR